jgi:hypothetical protein
LVDRFRAYFRLKSGRRAFVALGGRRGLPHLVYGEMTDCIGKIRKDFALSMGENCVHVSDAPETAATERNGFSGDE